MSSDETVYTLAAKSDLRSTMFIGRLFAVVCLLLVAFYWGFVYNNLLFSRTYPRFGSELPGTLYDNSFSLTWFFLALPSLSYITPLILLLALSNPARRTYMRIYFFYTAVMLFVLGIVMIALFFVWCGFFGLFGAKNTPWVPWNIANDDRYCGVHYATNPSTCPNVVDIPLNPPAATPVVMQSDLTTNPMFLLAWLGTAVFFVTHLLHLGYYATMKEYVNRAEFILA